MILSHDSHRGYKTCGLRGACQRWLGQACWVPRPVSTVHQSAVTHLGILQSRADPTAPVDPASGACASHRIWVQLSHSVRPRFVPLQNWLGGDENNDEGVEKATDALEAGRIEPVQYGSVWVDVRLANAVPPDLFFLERTIQHANSHNASV